MVAGAMAGRFENFKGADSCETLLRFLLEEASTAGESIDKGMLE